jgi:hypothetical protein
LPWPHATHALAPESEVFPASQPVQLELPVAAMKKPAAQGVHEPPPTSSEKEPAAQLEQAVAPPPDVKVPAGQMMQLELPVAGWKKPAAQVEHEATPPPAEKCPAGQARQVSEVADPATVAYWPAEQPTQLADPLDPW